MFYLQADCQNCDVNIFYTTMLPIERCKEILGERAAHLSDAQVVSIRDSLYSIVNLIFDNLQKKEIKKDEENEYAITQNGI